MIHDETEPRQILQTVDLDHELWSGRFSRSTSEFIDNMPDPASGLRTLFDKLSLIFQDDEFARRIYLACLWYYRARKNSGSLDGLLQSTIAMEVLLGDKETSDNVGVVRLLGNRCAYLPGTSRDTRQEIIDEFTSIYRVRSAIVHSGKHRLDRRDRDTIGRCFSLCGKVIARELDLHYASSPNTAS